MTQVNQTSAFGQLLEEAIAHPVTTFAPPTAPKLEAKATRPRPRIATRDGVLVTEEEKAGFYKGEIPRASFDAAAQYFYESRGRSGTLKIRRQRALRAILRLVATGLMAKDIVAEANAIFVYADDDLNQKLKEGAQKAFG